MLKSLVKRHKRHGQVTDCSIRRKEAEPKQILQPWFLIYDNEREFTCSAYVPYSNELQSLNSLSKDVRRSVGEMKGCNQSFGASGRLICFYEHTAEKSTFVVYNVFTRNTIRLPKLNIKLKKLLAVNVVENGDSFKVVLVAADSYWIQSITYDHADQRWKKGAALRKVTEKLENQHSVTCDQVVYVCFPSNTEGLDSHFMDLYAYDTAKDAWSVIKAPTIGPEYRLNFFNSQNQLALVGIRDGKNRGIGLTNICIWKLDPGNQRWMEIAEMPRSVAKKLNVLHSFDSMQGIQSCGNNKLQLLYEKGGSEMAIYDSGHMAWTQAPAPQGIWENVPISLKAVCVQPD